MELNIERLYVHILVKENLEKDSIIDTLKKAIVEKDKQIETLNKDKKSK